MIKLNKDAEIVVACTKCGQERAKPLGWFQENDSFTCEGCGSTVVHSVEKQLKAAIVSEIANPLAKQIRRANRKLK